MGLDMYLYQTYADGIQVDVGYWRKANAIHHWFVENVQKGVDDCGEYEVTRDQLKELRDLCRKVLKNSKLVKGKVWNGTLHTTEKGTQEIWEDGLVIEDSSVASELLPTASGFFFGSMKYDQYYLSDIVETVRIIEKALDESDGDIFHYQSSW